MLFQKAQEEERYFDFDEEEYVLVDGKLVKVEEGEEHDGDTQKGDV